MTAYKTIVEITDRDFGLDFDEKEASSFKSREAARGLVFRGNLVAVIDVTKHGFHKFPGGGMEGSESIEDAFVREILEEVGCHCVVDQKLGKIVEYRHKFKLKQTSYILTAQVDGEIGEPSLMSDEIADGFRLLWKPIEEVRSLLEKESPADYEGKFIVKRDLAITERYLKMLV